MKPDAQRQQQQVLQAELRLNVLLLIVCAVRHPPAG